MPCIGNDPLCPCQDGDACHYRDLPGSPKWPRIVDPHSRFRRLRDELAAIIAAAAAALPAGWALEIVAGSELAVELRLIDPRGRALPRFSPTERGPVYQHYRRFADRAYAAQRRLHPELAGRLAWGGMRTAEDGRWIIGQFDLAGLRGRGRYRPPL
jgi:hypothetical protein